MKYHGRKLHPMTLCQEGFFQFWNVKTQIKMAAVILAADTPINRKTKDARKLKALARAKVMALIDGEDLTDVVTVLFVFDPNMHF